MENGQRVFSPWTGQRGQVNHLKVWGRNDRPFVRFDGKLHHWGPWMQTFVAQAWR